MPESIPRRWRPLITAIANGNFNAGAYDSRAEGHSHEGYEAILSKAEEAAHDLITLIERQQQALRAAAAVIERLDGALTAKGRSRNLLTVPGFQGQNFVDLLRELGKESS